MNVIFGSAGFAKEVDWLINDLIRDGQESYPPDFFVSRNDIGKLINGKKVIDENEFLNMIPQNDVINAFFSIGSPLIKRKIHESFHQFKQIYYPNLIHPNVLFDKRNSKIEYGIGNIFCAGTILTTDIKIGNFVHINLGATIGHDSSIGDYSTISPGSHISGNVHFGNDVFVGTGAVILERISVCNAAVIGAGAVVTKSIDEPGTYIGIPAKRIK